MYRYAWTSTDDMPWWLCWEKESGGAIISPSSLILLVKDRRFDCSCYFNTELGLLQVC